MEEKKNEDEGGTELFFDPERKFFDPIIKSSEKETKSFWKLAQTRFLTSLQLRNNGIARGIMSNGGSFFHPPPLDGLRLCMLDEEK